MVMVVTAVAMAVDDEDPENAVPTEGRMVNGMLDVARRCARRLALANEEYDDEDDEDDDEDLPCPVAEEDDEDDEDDSTAVREAVDDDEKAGRCASALLSLLLALQWLFRTRRAIAASVHSSALFSSFLWWS